MAQTIQPSLKRKQTGNIDGNDFIRSDSKRPRVAFDSAVEVHILEDWREKGIGLAREEVRCALQNHRNGQSIGYDELKQLYTMSPSSENAPSTALLGKYTQALMGQVSLLNKTYSGLVHAMLECHWLARDEKFVSLYIRFLGSLISAHGGYLSSVLRMVVSHFVHCRAFSDRHPSDPRIAYSQIRDRPHQCLRYILQLIPSASGVLSSVLSSTFPFYLDPTKSHVRYITNLLRIVEYAPELRAEILALITERVVKIDVQIQVDMEDLEDMLDGNAVHDMLQCREHDDDPVDDGDLIDSDDESVSSEGSDSQESRIKKIRQAVEKMDAILDILFDYYHSIFSEGSNTDIQYAFDNMLSMFSNTILPTHRSRHTQFLLFHFSQASPQLIKRFADDCVRIALDDKSKPHLIRLGAAAYLASFLARGAHVSTRVVRNIFNMLAQHLDDLCKKYESACAGPDLRRFGAYYAIAQALLYIFCFRWRDLILDLRDDIDDYHVLFEGRDLNWIPGIRDVLRRNIYSKFNPLKVCSPPIVSQFARIAHYLRFMYVFPLIETNKRFRLARSIAAVVQHRCAIPEREMALPNNGDESCLQLDAYFPFDPYHLPRSKRWIHGDYVEWKSIPGLEDEDYCQESDVESDVEDQGSTQDIQLHGIGLHANI